MSYAFQAGGWPMFFTLAFGIWAIYGAARFCWRGEVALERFTRWLMGATALSSMFGFFVGMAAVAAYIDAHAKSLDERVAFLIQGSSESLNNLELGVLLSVVSCLLMALGQRRFSRTTP